MSFKEYLKEQDELVVVQAEDERREKIVDFIKTIDDLNDSKFHDFAVNELGMGESEAETLVYQLLKDFLIASDKDGDGIPDILGDEGDADVDADDILADIGLDGGDESVDDEIDAEIDAEEESYV